ncbi:hypothetical protein GN244_ATG03781 [Phytophthora infestans]|uniref:Uncharacterized protein n=1 Tax=Phytophthora infestans TaxID=4787 RepID=A0A833WJS3_PHYIN|nr:hypothetical protein GN244_ATG03781 [Phytophthora infestans]
MDDTIQGLCSPPDMVNRVAQAEIPEQVCVLGQSNATSDVCTAGQTEAAADASDAWRRGPPLHYDARKDPPLDRLFSATSHEIAKLVEVRKVCGSFCTASWGAAANV